MNVQGSEHVFGGVRTGVLRARVNYELLLWFIIRTYCSDFMKLALDRKAEMVKV